MISRRNHGVEREGMRKKRVFAMFLAMLVLLTSVNLFVFAETDISNDTELTTFVSTYDDYITMSTSEVSIEECAKIKKAYKEYAAFTDEQKATLKAHYSEQNKSFNLVSNYEAAVLIYDDHTVTTTYLASKASQDGYGARQSLTYANGAVYVGHQTSIATNASLIAKLSLGNLTDESDNASEVVKHAGSESAIYNGHANDMCWVPDETDSTKGMFFTAPMEGLGILVFDQDWNQIATCESITYEGKTSKSFWGITYGEGYFYIGSSIGLLKCTFDTTDYTFTVVDMLPSFDAYIANTTQTLQYAEGCLYYVSCEPTTLTEYNLSTGAFTNIIVEDEDYEAEEGRTMQESAHVEGIGYDDANDIFFVNYGQYDTTNIFSFKLKQDSTTDEATNVTTTVNVVDASTWTRHVFGVDDWVYSESTLGGAVYSDGSIYYAEPAYLNTNESVYNQRTRIIQYNVETGTYTCVNKQEDAAYLGKADDMCLAPATASGKVFVTDTYNGKIYLVDANWQIVGEVDWGKETYNAVGIACVDNDYYIVDTNGNWGKYTYSEVKGENDITTYTLTLQGTTSKFTDYTGKIQSLDTDGHSLYLLSYGNDSTNAWRQFIQVYDLQGIYLEASQQQYESNSLYYRFLCNDGSNFYNGWIRHGGANITKITLADDSRTAAEAFAAKWKEQMLTESSKVYMFNAETIIAAYEAFQALDEVTQLKVLDELLKENETNLQNRYSQFGNITKLATIEEDALATDGSFDASYAVAKGMEDMLALSPEIDSATIRRKNTNDTQSICFKIQIPEFSEEEYKITGIGMISTYYSWIKKGFFTDYDLVKGASEGDYKNYIREDSITENLTLSSGDTFYANVGTVNPDYYGYRFVVRVWVEYEKTDGSKTICYSKNTTDGGSLANGVGVEEGVCSRSVTGLAQEIAKRIYKTGRAQEPYELTNIATDIIATYDEATNKATWQKPDGKTMTITYLLNYLSENSQNIVGLMDALDAGYTGPADNGLDFVLEFDGVSDED